jgi:hypothetical protein
MPWVGFEPTIPEFERAKTVHALDRAAIVIGFFQFLLFLIGEFSSLTRKFFYFYSLVWIYLFPMDKT